MKRVSMHAVALAGVLSLAACREPVDQRTAAEPDPMSPQVGRVAPTAGDQDFVQRATEKNLAEIELSRLAAEQAQSPQVRQYAQTMIDDHTKALEELRQIAQRDNLPINEELREADRELRDRLQGMSGAEFDREYMNAMVEGHEEMHNLLQDRADRDLDRAAVDRPPAPEEPIGTAGPAERTTDPQLNQWASRTLPVVEQHRDQARQLQEQLEER